MQWPANPLTLSRGGSQFVMRSIPLAAVLFPILCSVGFAQVVDTVPAFTAPNGVTIGAPVDLAIDMYKKKWGPNHFESFSADHDGKQLPIEFEIYEMPRDRDAPIRTRIFFNPSKARVAFANILEYSPRESREEALEQWRRHLLQLSEVHGHPTEIAESPAATWRTPFGSIVLRLAVFEFGERSWPQVQTIYLLEGYELPAGRRRPHRLR